MKLKVYNKDGKDAGRSVTLDPDVFQVEPNDHAIWLDVRRVQSNRRQGTHKTKERSETAGSTRKLYRQKGTGHARSGDAKSPLRRSGGRTFGPSPRNYGFKLNRKTQRLARRSAFAYKAQDKAIRIVEDFSFESPSTKELLAVLDAQNAGETKVLLLTNGVQSEVARSADNLSKVAVREGTAVSTLDILDSKLVIIQEGVVDALASALSGKKAETETVA